MENDKHKQIENNILQKDQMDAEMNRQKQLAEKTTIQHYLTNNYEKDITDKRHQRDNQVTLQKLISPLLIFNLDGTGEVV